MNRLKLVRQVRLNRQGRPYTVIQVAPRQVNPWQWVDLAIFLAVTIAGIWMLAS